MAFIQNNSNSLRIFNLFDFGYSSAKTPPRTKLFASKGSRIQIPRGNHMPPTADKTASWKMPDNPNNAGGYRPASYKGGGSGGPGGHGGRGPGNSPSGNQHGFNMGKQKKKRSGKKIFFIVVAILIVLAAVLIGADFALNSGKVHYGVKVEGVDIGGMTKAEATAELQTKLDSKLAGATVQAKPNAATVERLAQRSVAGDQQTEAPVATDSAEAASDGASATTWVFTAIDMGARVDAAVSVEEAYQIGQVNDFFDVFPAIAQRFGSWIGQVDLSAEVIYDEDLLAAALKPVNDTIGIVMVNSNITIDANGFATVQTGQIGEQVDTKNFKVKAQKAFFGETSDIFEMPLVAVPLDISDAEAQVVADEVNAAIAQPVSFTYEDRSWTAETALLGSWISTSVEGAGETAKLVPAVDINKGYDGLQALLGDAGYGTAQNAHIDVSSGTPVIVGGTPGIGPDITTAVSELDTILFGGAGASRHVDFIKAEVEPAVTAQAVADMGIVELITTFELGYGSGGGSNRELNIERCLDSLNGSIVAPGNNWNWNEVVGLCDTSTGYLDAGAINSENEIVQEPGGGICNVATGVFNAAYEAGLPVLERANHSLYMSNYPLGRDAAVSWQYPTLVFQNDTDRHILVTARYDGSTMFISIWGTSPHRTVESKNTDWVDTQDGGKTITNYRTVKSADGSLWFEDSFYSYFPPVKEKEAS